MSLFTAAMDKYQLGENGHIENKWAFTPRSLCSKCA